MLTVVVRINEVIPEALIAVMGRNAGQESATALFFRVESSVCEV